MGYIHSLAKVLRQNKYNYQYILQCKLKLVSQNLIQIYADFKKLSFVFLHVTKVSLLYIQYNGFKYKWIPTVMPTLCMLKTQNSSF